MQMVGRLVPRFILVAGFLVGCPGGDDAPAATCDASETLCGGVWVDLQSDLDNCGACGRACALGQVCEQGGCTAADCPALPYGFICDDRCIDPATDPEHCGGLACEGPEAGQVCQQPEQACVNGECQTVACTGDEVMCASGCADLQTDRLNCGTCGHFCYGICVGGVCQCPTDSLQCGEYCVDPQTDPSNCGGCDVACADDQSCNDGACGPCAPPMVVCPDGCVDLQTNWGNCGSCDNDCGGYFGGCVDGECSP